jgi:imidazole glycerol-phosphate synthase subunit HisH
MDAAIIDSGGANLASLQYALERLGARTVVTCDPAVISQAPRVLLPGVGAAADAMRRLTAAGLTGLLPTLKQPVLGICLGMQLLFTASEEGSTTCLGILPDTVRRLTPKQGLPVPHMGWNQLVPLTPDPLLEGIRRDDYAYFVHSFAAGVSGHTLATAEYGEPLTAVVRRGNFWGTQFHPERSAATGARILANFLGVEV